MTKWEIRNTGLKGKALCQFETGNLLIYRAGHFDLIAPDDRKVINSFNLPFSTLKKKLCKVRLLERVLHAEPRWACCASENEALVYYGSNLWLVNVETGSYKAENLKAHGKPLQISRIHVEGFLDSYALGDYWKNQDREEVHIYQRCLNSNMWNTVYTFPKGAVRHIHGIIADEKSKAVYILTGDEDNESGIWICRNNFQDVKPLLIGSQQYRACQMMIAGTKMYYSTDAPSETNHLYMYDGCSVKKINKVAGSVIYGVREGDSLLFATTVEPDAHAKNKIEYWLTNKRGIGIIDDSVHIYSFSEKDGLEEIFAAPHDRLPLRLFQYGAATFCRGENDGKIYVSFVSVRGLDYQIYEIKDGTIQRNGDTTI